MKVLLLGATGFIAQALCDEILSEGWDLTSMIRNPQSIFVQKFKDKGISVVQGDILHPGDLESNFKGYDLVIHNAGYYELGVIGAARTLMENINVNGTANVMQAASKMRVPRLVYVSSTMAFGATDEEPVDETYRRKYPCHSFYEETKSRAHEIAVQWIDKGLPVIIVCPDGVMGVNDYSIWGYLLRMRLNGLLPVSWGPNYRQSHVFRFDLAKGIVLASEKGRVGEIYLFAGDALPRRDLMELWNRCIGEGKIWFWVSDKAAMRMFSPMAGIFRMMGMPAVLSREIVRTGSCYYNFSSKKARRELGWSYTPAEEMWKQIISGEQELKKKRKNKLPWMRLKPLPE